MSVDPFMAVLSAVIAVAWGWIVWRMMVDHHGE